MAATIVSNLAVFSDATGHGNQSHLIYVTNQQRWWLFVVKTQTASVVSCYVSSSADLTTATWGASTDSPTLTQAHSTNDQRNLGVVYVAIGATDAVHVDVTTTASNLTGAVSRTAHIRATITGAAAISWDVSWSETATTNAASAPRLRKGNTLGISTTGVVHKCQNIITNSGTNNLGDPIAARATNADNAPTWTNGFNSSPGVAVDDSMAGPTTAFAFGQLASDAMLLVLENATTAGSETVSTGLRYNTYTSGLTWPANTGTADVGIGTSSQDANDWCLCTVDSTHIYAIRRDSNNTFLWRVFNGASWSTPVNAPPTYNQGASVTKAGAGVFAATNGIDLYLFVIDNGTNNPIYYAKASSVNGSAPTWGGWTLLEAAGSAARNYISGFPSIGPNQFGVIYTVVNGSNFDIVVSTLSIGPLHARQNFLGVRHGFCPRR